MKHKTSLNQSPMYCLLIEVEGKQETFYIKRNGQMYTIDCIQPLTKKYISNTFLDKLPGDISSHDLFPLLRVTLEGWRGPITGGHMWFLLLYLFDDIIGSVPLLGVEPIGTFSKKP